MLRDRISPELSEFLRYLADAGMQIGAEGVVRHNSAELGVVTTEVDGQPITIAIVLAW